MIDNFYKNIILVILFYTSHYHAVSFYECKIKAIALTKQELSQIKATHKLESMTERKITSSNYANQVFLEEKCALNELIHLLSKRWITEVLFSIEDGYTRFSSIKDHLSFISDNILLTAFVSWKKVNWQVKNI